MVAVDRGGLIGAHNGLPWRLPADLRYFRRITMGKPILMGRRTHESIGRALPGRSNLILSRTPGYRAEGCRVADDFDAALALAGDTPELMVIGGASLYRVALPRAGRMYITRVDASLQGDTWFPDYDPTEWVQRSLESHPADADNEYAYSFEILDRR